MRYMHLARFWAWCGPLALFGLTEEKKSDERIKTKALLGSLILFKMFHVLRKIGSPLKIFHQHLGLEILRSPCGMRLVCAWCAVLSLPPRRWAGIVPEKKSPAVVRCNCLQHHGWDRRPRRWVLVFSAENSAEISISVIYLDTNFISKYYEISDKCHGISRAHVVYFFTSEATEKKKSTISEETSGEVIRSSKTGAVVLGFFLIFFLFFFLVLVLCLSVCLVGWLLGYFGYFGCLVCCLLLVTQHMTFQHRSR